MIKASQVNLTSWVLPLSNVVKTVYGTVRRRPIPPAAMPKAPLLTLHASEIPGPHAALCLTVAGELNWRTYQTLVDTAHAHYRGGQQALILDLSMTTSLELAGIFAILNIARLYSGQPLLDAEQGWQALHRLLAPATPALGARVKLLAPSPQAIAALARVTGGNLLEQYPTIESAAAAFGNEQKSWHAP